LLYFSGRIWYFCLGWPSSYLPPIAGIPGICLYISLVICFFVVLGFELRASRLLGRLPSVLTVTQCALVLSFEQQVEQTGCQAVPDRGTGQEVPGFPVPPFYIKFCFLSVICVHCKLQCAWGLWPR
jgi:hypothetical protein